MRSFKKYLPRFGLVLAGLVVALLLAEGFVRVFFPHSRDNVVPGGLFAIDDDLGWKLAEGKSAVHHTRYFETAYRINDLGYRDRPRNAVKNAEIYRALLYGDSQIFGWGTPAEQRFSDLIEDRTPQLEMWNLAVPGYGLDQEVLSYEKQGDLFDADEVIFFISGPTLYRIDYDTIYRKQKPKFAIDQNDSLQLVRIQGGANAWTRLFYRVLSPLYLPYFVDRRLTALKRSLKQADDASEPTATAESDSIGDLAKQILDRAGNAARERNHTMTILADLPQTQRISLKEFCDRRGWGFLQIALPEDDPDLVFGEHDGHWNPEAHKRIAGQLLSQWETRIHLPVESE